jgi:hypothetical protein
VGDVTTRACRVLVCATALSALSAAASAQTAGEARPERPYRGLFASGGDNWGQSLIASLTLGGGWDQDLLADAVQVGTISRPDQQRAGPFATGTAGLGYRLSRKLFNVSATYGQTARYYPSLDRDILVTHGAGVQVTGGLPLGPSTTFSFAQGVAYQPYQALSSFANLTPGAPDFDLSVTEEAFFISSSASVDHQLSGRTTFSTGVGHRQGAGGGVGGQRDTSINAGFSFAIAKGLAWRAGYSISEIAYDIGATTTRYRSHGFGGGLDFNRALSLTRRTTLRFSTAMVGTQRSGEPIHLGVTGAATLHREVGRTWGAALSAGRSLHFIHVLREPLYHDEVAVGFGGLVNRYLQFNSGASYSVGRLAFGGVRGARAASASAGLTVALTRSLALGVNYLYYEHSYRAGLSLPAGTPRSVERHGVRAYLSVWAPIFHRDRRPDDSR